MQNKIALVIVEDDQKIRDGYSIYFKIQADIAVQAAYDSVEAFLEHHTQTPGVVLLDINLNGISGVQGIQKIKSKWPGTNIVMLTNYDDAEHIFASLKSGANGYLLKSTSLAKIKEGILDIQQNGAPMSPGIAKKVIAFFNPGFKSTTPKPNTLTPRENDVVAGLVEGLSYQHIAEKLDMSVETVRHHIKNIYLKLHVNSKVEVVSKVLKGEI